MCVPRPAVIFVSSQHYKGNFGGLIGADAKCQALAQAAPLPGTFKAYLSDSLTSANSRLLHTARPYALVDGTIVVLDYAGLISTPHLAPVDLDEKGGTPPASTYVWTGMSFGEVGITSFDCSRWGTNSASVFGIMLSTSDIDWSKQQEQACDLSDDTQFPEDGRLFCVEQLQ
jgi:hypothetical protein